jgi:hypothetical protein
VAQKIEQLIGLAAAGAEMNVRDPDAAKSQNLVTLLFGT